MRRKTLVSAAAIAAVAALALSGCSGSSGGSSGPVTITFWNSFTAADKSSLEHIVSDFNASQKSVKVVTTVMPDDVLQQKLLPAYSAGQGPTITSLDASQMPGYAKLGVLAPVDDLYSSGGLDKATLPKASLDATEYNGKQYGVPMAATDSMLYYNKKLFAAAGIASPPTTMDELASDAVKMTKYSAGNETKNVYGFIVPDHASVSVWSVLLWSMGGSILNASNTKSTLGSPATIKAFEYWNDLIQKDHITPAGLGGSDTDALFGAGRAAMYVDGPWASDGFKSAGIDFGVVPIPKGTAGQYANAVSVNMHLNAKASPAQKQAADKFFEYWNSAKTQTYWSLHTSYPPNLSTVPASALSGNPTAAIFKNAVGGKFYLAGLTQYTAIDTTVMTPTIQKITNNQGTPAQLLPQAAASIDALLAKK